jgi:hypothetical protein
MKKYSSYIIGVDFDNTIINYDQLFLRLANKEGWGKPGLVPGKKEIRDHVRRLDGGENKWQKLQGLAYGAEINGAVRAAGVMKFFARCRQEGVATYIVSHKTEFAAQDKYKVNLRHCAVDWLTYMGFLSGDAKVIAADRLFFEETRLLKIDRIKQLGCTHFIDDLAELFADPAFPAGVKKIHYSPFENSNFSNGICLSSWSEINDYFFN